MLFFVPLLAVTTLLQTIIPGVPTPETFVPVNAAARGTDVSLWILQQCPSPATTLAELELALQLGSSDALVYTAPIGLYAWRSSPKLRAWSRTLVTHVGHLLSASRYKLNSRRRSTRHTRAAGHDGFPNGTLAGWYAGDERHGHVYLALAMAQIGLLSPAVLTLPAPPLVLGLPAPVPILSLPAPRPILSLPAPAPVLGLPAPAPVLSITVLTITPSLSTLKPIHTLPAFKSIYTQPTVQASLIPQVLPTSSAPNLEEHVLPSPGLVPFRPQPTSAVSVAPHSLQASKVSTALSTPVRGFYPVVTKPVIHSTTRKWRHQFLMACLVVLTLASRLFKGLGRHLVGANYPLDGAIRGEPGRLEIALDPFGALAIDVADTTRSGILGGLAPDLFRFCGQPEPVGAAFGHGSSGGHGGLEQDLDPFNKLAIDTSDVVRSGRLSGLAPDLFRFCNPPEFPDAALEDTLDGPVGLVGTTGATIGEDTREELLVLGNASAGTREAEGVCEMDTASAIPDIPSGVADAGPREDVGLESPDVECEGALRGPLEPGPGSIEAMAEGRLDTHCEEVGGEARGGEHPVDTMAGQLGPIGGDSSKGLGDPLGQEGFSWSDEAETCLANDTIAKAGQPVDPPFELEDKHDRPEPGPSNFEPEREGARQRAQAGGSSILSSRLAPQSEGGRRRGYRGGQGGGSRGGDGMQNGGWSRGGWNRERGGGYGSGRGAYSGGGRGGYDGHGSGRSGYSGGRGGLGNGNGGNGGGRGGGSYRGGGHVGREGRDGTRRESKASYFFRLRHEQKDAARAAAEN